MVRKKEDPQKLDFLMVDGTRYRTNLIRKYEIRKPWTPEDPDKVYTLIPGTVVKIMVKEGQKVTPGKCLYVLEAMKMKNRFNAERAGTIVKIHVEEGVTIPKQHLVMEYGDVPEQKTSRPMLRRSKSRKKSEK